MILLPLVQISAQEGNQKPPTKGTPVAVPAFRQATNVAVITVRGVIDQVSVQSIERRLKDAALAGADGVVFEIDTFGGQAAAALEICEVIKNSPITKTTAWIHPKAYSAGTFIALACNEIVLAPRATIGDCAPILPGLIPIPAAERAKIESPLLEEVMESAALNGYDAKLCISFVAVDMELWFIRNTATGKYRFVDRKDYQFLFGEDPPEDARTHGSGGIPIGDQAFENGNQMIERFVPRGRSQRRFGPTSRSPSSTGKSMDERIAEAAQQLAVPPPAQPLTESDRDKYELIEPVVNSKQLLVLKTPRAMRYGFGKKVVSNDQELQAFIGATNLTRYNETWSEGLVRILTSMPIRILFIIVFAIGLIWEMSTPGVGVPGSIAAGALIVLLGAPALTGMAQWWDILFVIVGIGLIAAEVFVIPGFGISGICGIILFALGFVGTFIAPDPGGGLLPSSPEAQSQGLRGMFALLVAFFACSIALYFISKHMRTLPVLNKLVLSGTSGDSAASHTMLGAMRDPAARLPSVGTLGEATTTLRPSGRARIGDEIYDVISKRGVIEPGSRVVVKSADRFSITVELANESDGPK